MSDTCELIDSLEQEWCKSLCAKDIDRLRSLIHPKFMLIGTRATGPFTMSRDEWLDAVQRREIVGIDIDIKDAAIFDSVMVGTVEAKWRVSYMGRAIEDCVLLTDVWVKENDRWQVVRRHSSPIPAGPEETPAPAH